MSLYLDTSLVVAMLAEEKHSARTERWLQDHQDAVLIVSDWVTTEIAAALSAKVRLGAMAEAQQQETMRTYADLCRASFKTVPVARPHFERAASMAGVVEAGLRGGDALHLAIAVERDARVCTLDKQFARACAILKLPCELV